MKESTSRATRGGRHGSSGLVAAGSAHGPHSNARVFGGKGACSRYPLSSEIHLYSGFTFT